jgi:hypothetical protein
MDKIEMDNPLFSFNALAQPVTPVVWQMPSATYRSFAEFEIAREAIEQFSFQDANWDGYGALPISLETKGNALVVLNTLAATAPAPSVIPNPNGTLSFEWETDQGLGKLEIGRTQYSFYVRPTVGPAILYDGRANEVGCTLGTFVEGLLYSKPLKPTQSIIHIGSNV